MKNLNHYVLAIALVNLCGCSNLIIDASSNESMKQSYQKIREALNEDRNKIGSQADFEETRTRLYDEKNRRW